MNEKIEELAEECGIIGGDIYEDRVVDYEKFAELIVLDCAYIADQNFSLRIPTGQFMKKYFGVEE